MGFLDNTGVARLWQHILVKVNERLTVDPSVAEEGAANLINADSLGGVLAKDYATKADIDAIDILVADPTLTQEGLAAESKATGTRFIEIGDRVTTAENRITTVENNKVESINGLTGKNITLDVGTMGAVLKTGDTMSGTLTIKTPLYSSLLLRPTQNGVETNCHAVLEGSYVGAASFAAWEDVSGANRRMLEVRTKAYENSLDNACVLRDVVDNNYAAYRVFHSGMETAIPIENGGTGAVDAAAARVNLGITPENIGVATILQATEIPSNADLNAYTTPGTFRSPSGTVSATLINTPYTETGFRLEIFNTTSNNQIIQEIKCNSASARTYRRTASLANGTWTFNTWYQALQTANGVIPISQGGTGATDASNARKNLLTTSLKTTDVATTALVQGVQVSILEANAAGTGDPTGGTLLTAANSNVRGMQIANGYSANSLKWRFIHTGQTSDAGVKGYSPWYTIYHSGNINALMAEITNRLSNASGVSF